MKIKTLDVTKSKLEDIIASTCRMLSAPDFSASETRQRFDTGYRAALQFKLPDDSIHEIFLRCPSALAERITVEIFQVDESTISEKLVEDALSEMVNIVGGNLIEYYPSPVESTFADVEKWEQVPSENQRDVYCRLTGTCLDYPMEIDLCA